MAIDYAEARAKLKRELKVEQENLLKCQNTIQQLIGAFTMLNYLESLEEKADSGENAVETYTVTDK